MEQNPSPNHVIIDWLADYTHYICDRFGVPHDQAEGLLQHYLNLTARGHPQKSAVSSYEQPASYPEPPDPLHEALIREQYLNPHLDPRLQNQPLSYSEPSSTRYEPLPREQLQDPHLATQFQDQPMSHSARFSSHHETDGGDEADDLSTLMATTAPNEAPRTQFFPYDQQPWNNMNIDSGLPEAAAPSSSQTRTPNPTTVGTITDYDPLWVQKDNVDPVQVENFNSAMKFDTLFSQGVIKLDDVLTFQVSVTTNGQEEETEAHLKVIGNSRCSTTPGKYPDLSVSVLNAPGVRYPEAKACRGTTAIIGHLQACNINVLRKGWADIQVIRGQQALGSLWWVKQAFHLWRDKKDEEAMETGQYFRRRQVRKKGVPSGTTQHNGSFGVWHDKTFVPDPNQGRYRGRG